MPTRTTRANPAAPALPRALTSGTVADHPMGEETTWWQVELSGSGNIDAELATVEQSKLSRVDVSGSRWRQTVWRDCEVAAANLANVAATGSTWRRVAARDSRATGLSFIDGNLTDVTFTECRLDLTAFRFTKLSHVVFDRCRLTGVDFTAAKLSRVRFVECDLSGARLHEASMDSVTIEQCELDGLTGARALRGATITAVDLMPLTLVMADELGITVSPQSS